MKHHNTVAYIFFGAMFYNVLILTMVSIFFRIPYEKQILKNEKKKLMNLSELEWSDS